MEAKLEAQRLIDSYGRIAAKNIINEIIDLLVELNSVKMCQFHKEIDYYNEVLKGIDLVN